MATKDEPAPRPLTEADKQALKDRRNDAYKQQLADIVRSNHTGFKRLRFHLAITYWVLVAMLVVMFALGIFLVLVNGSDIVSEATASTENVLGMGAGGIDLVLLGLARPVERIRQVKNDRVQMFVLLSDYQVQTTTALLWYRSDDRNTILQAADRIRDLTLETIELIETHLAVTPTAPVRVPAGVLDRLAEENRAVVDRLTEHLAGGADVATDPTGTARRVVGRTLRRSPLGVPDYGA